MNPRQRRGVLLILVTVLGAVVTFVAMFSYVQSISSQVGPMTTVLKLSQQVTELKEITAADVVTEQVPKRWVPEDAIHDVNDLKGKVAAATLNKGAVLQTSMLQDPPQLTEGYREVSIMIDAETGVAGKVTPGSRVDIVSTVENPDTKAQKSEFIVQNALITEVGVTTKVQDKDENGNFSEEKDSVPVTFSLTPEQSLKLAYAESFSKKVRLLLRRDGDQGTAQAPEYSANPGTPAQGAN